MRFVIFCALLACGGRKGRDSAAEPSSEVDTSDTSDTNDTSDPVTVGVYTLDQQGNYSDTNFKWACRVIHGCAAR